MGATIVQTGTAEQMTGPNAPTPAGQQPTAPQLVPGTAVPRPEAGVAPVNAPAAPPAPAERPAWLPPNFKTPEDFAKSYQELERKLGAPKPAKGDDKPAKGADAGVLSPAELDAFSAEYSKDGALSPASYDALAAKGLTRDIVDGFIEGQKARTERTLNDALAAVGGRGAFEAAQQWAATAFTDAELAVFNEDVASPNQARVAAAMQSLVARHQASTGGRGVTQRPGQQYTGQSTATSQPTQTFQSRAQVVAAMSDPRYKTDTAYQEAVKAALANADVFVPRSA
jgi:hypothetical protein